MHQVQSSIGFQPSHFALYYTRSLQIQKSASFLWSFFYVGWWEALISRCRNATLRYDCSLRIILKCKRNFLSVHALSGFKKDTVIMVLLEPRYSTSWHISITYSRTWERTSIYTNLMSLPEKYDRKKKKKENIFPECPEFLEDSFYFLFSNRVILHNYIFPALSSMDHKWHQQELGII